MTNAEAIGQMLDDVGERDMIASQEYMTKLQKSQIIYTDLVYVLDKFGIDITREGIASVIKGAIYSSLEKIEQNINN